MGLLFLGVANATRSPLAEALARHLAPDVAVYSAGVAPSHVHPQVRRTLSELGVDPRGLRAQGLLEMPLDELTDVVLLCRPEQAPPLPGHLRQHRWALPDPGSAPAPEADDAFDATRDELLRRLPGVLAQVRGGVRDGGGALR